jgi:acyltransferase
MKRMDYLDYAKVLGIFFVYYGYFVQALYETFGINSVLAQLKFVYSFHMPFLFFLAGVFWKPVPLSREFFFQKIKTRFVPWVFFSLLLIPFWIWFKSEEFLKFLLGGRYLRGDSLNDVTWFFICLMLVDLLAALVAKYLRVEALNIFIYSLLLFFFGYYVLIRNAASVVGMTGINPAMWHMDAAFIGVMFYFFGYLSRNALIKINEGIGWWSSLAITPLAGFLLLKIHQLNSAGGEVVLVLMDESRYGKLRYFLLAGLIGIVFLLFLSRLISMKLPFISFVAKNTFVFLGLSGVCFHFVDKWVISYLGLKPVTGIEVFVYAAIYVFVSMVVFSPIVMGLRRWFPELMGYEWSPTSILPPISEWAQRGIGHTVYSFTKKYVIN